MYLSDLSDMRESANKGRQILEYDPDYKWWNLRSAQKVSLRNLNSLLNYLFTFKNNLLQPKKLDQLF